MRCKCTTPEEKSRCSWNCDALPFIPLSVACDMSQASFAEAAMVIGSSFTYNLYVASPYLNYARRIAASVLADNRENPFAPYINVLPDDSLGREWYLEANGKKVGSKMG